MLSTRAFRQLSAARLLVGPSRQHAIRSFSISYRRSVPEDPYPLPLSPELEKQRAAPQGGIVSETSSDLNTTTEEEWPMPQPLDRTGEDEQTIRARLVYQTRKRGMLEGDLLLSTFARDNLGTMTMAQLQEFDKMLDEPDWDIYYWSIEKRHPPERWAGTELLERLKKHARNEGKVVRFMPELKDQMPGGASS